MSDKADLYKEQRKFIDDKFLRAVNDSLENADTDADREDAKEILDAIEANQTEDLLEKYYSEYKAEKLNSSPGGKRKSFKKIFHERIWELVDSFYSVKIGPNGPKKKYSSEDGLKDRVRELVDEFEPQTKRQLIPRLVQVIIQVEILEQKIEELRSGSEFLIYHYFKHLLERQETVKNQKTGKDKVFSSNNQCMKECLDEVLNAGLVNKPLSKLTYTKFCRLIKKKYPTPPVLQKARLSKEEKMQSAADQKADREALARNEWAPTTLRAFFEKALKVHIKDLPK
jgi:hypothetical protein